MVNPAGQPLVERLAWDSEFFGREIGRARIGRLDDATAARLIGEALDLGLECLYFVASADELETLRAAEERSFHLVEVRVVLERLVDAPLPPPDDVAAAYVIEPGRDDELARLQDIAVQVAGMSRYAADPRFSADETERLYRAWIANALHGYADAVLVAREQARGEALGFLCCKMHGELCDVQLVGVDRKNRQRKVGRALFDATIAWARAHGATRIQIVTQGRNVPALRLYQQLGFLTSEVKLCYHVWLPNPGR